MSEEERMDGPSASSGHQPTTGSERAGEIGQPKAKAQAQRKPRGRLLNRPTIDLDGTIEAAKQAARDAAKALTLARSEARANRKRRARLLNKAATLSAEDLERIAVLKRTGRFADATTDDQQLERGTASTDATAKKASAAGDKEEKDKEPAEKKHRAEGQGERSEEDARDEAKSAKAAEAEEAEEREDEEEDE